MSEDSGTRSSLLWQVKRLLQECEEKPQVLMMENVTQIHSTKNIPDFQKWIDFLDSIGYVSFYQDLNAKDYGIPQSRNRCFMFSFLKSEFGENPQFEFPKPIPLDKTLKDVLEDKVDDRYYLNSEKAKILIDQLIEDGRLEPQKEYIRQSVGGNS